MSFKNKIPVLIALLLTITGIVSGQSKDIKVFRPATNPRDKTSPMVIAAEEYKKLYGGKVSLVISDWGNSETKILQAIAAGEPIDVIFAGESSFPKFYFKNYLQPLDNYVNLNVPYINKYGMEKAFKYEGKYLIASNRTSNHPWLMIYNKTLMEEEGIPESQQPKALADRGEWTWAKLRELSMKLTKYSSGSGKIDRWGFGTWYTDGFVYMNNSNFTVKDGKGNYKLNFDDPKFVEALQFLADAKKEGWYMQDNSIVETGLQRRTVAIVLERQYFPVSVVSQTRDEIAYAPLPRGPSASESLSNFGCDGYGIGYGSKNQEWAGKYIDLCLKAWYESDIKGRATWPKEIHPIVTNMEKSAQYPALLASPVQPIIGNLLGEIVWTGLAPSTAISMYEPVAKILVDEATKAPEKIVKLPFKPIEINFDNSNFDGMTINPETKSVKTSIVSGKEAIKGKSLLVKMDHETDGEWINAILTDPEKIGIVGWRDYRITFDFKALNPPVSEESSVYVEVYKNEINKWGYNNVTIKEADKVYQMTTIARDVLVNGKFGLKIGGHLSGDIVIDNIKITER